MIEIWDRSQLPLIYCHEVIGMVWYVIAGTLAAFGALCALWVVCGWLLGKGSDGALICLCDGHREEALLLRYSQLRSAGLLRCPLVLVDSSFSPREQQLLCRRHPDLIFCTLDTLPAWLETERSRFE